MPFNFPTVDTVDDPSSAHLESGNAAPGKMPRTVVEENVTSIAPETLSQIDSNGEKDPAISDINMVESISVNQTQEGIQRMTQ